MSLVFLPSEAVQRLTGRKRYKAQRKALDRLGIRYTQAATGEPLVRDEALDARPVRGRNAIRWDRVNA
jgi:hypothetical protein